MSSTQRRGAEVFGEQLSGALVSAAWEADFAALRRIDTGAEVSALPILGPNGETSGLRPRLVMKLRRRIRELSPEIVLAGGGATLKYSVAALWGISGTLLVYSSIGEPDYWADNPAHRLMMALLLRRTDLVTAVSTATADQLIHGFGLTEDKVRVVHPGVPEEFLQVGQSERHDGLRILFMGSLSDEKDPLAAIECVGAMSRPGTLRFVGTGPLLDRLRRIGSAGNNAVEAIGPVDDVKPQLEWADVLLLTSRTEGLPGVVLEAGAAAVPVVGFDVGGVTEAVEHGVTGFVHEMGDTSGVAASLDLLASEDGLAQRLGLSARKKVSGHFLLTQAVERYIAVLETLVRR